MVSTRSTTFLLVFILLIPLRFSTTHTQHQGKKKTLVVAKLETETSPVEVEIRRMIYHGVPEVAETDQRTRFVPAGRKMIMSREVLLSKKSNNVAESEKGVNVAKGLTKTWKGRCLIRYCNHEKGKTKHKDSKKSNEHSTKVSLNADYYVPRPHPPKNN